MSKQFFQRFLNDERGANIIEFAFVAPVFFLLFLGILEFGLFTFHQVVVQSIVAQASREASLGKTAGGGACGTTSSTVEYIRCLVQQKSSALIRGNTVQVVVNRITASGGITQPDVCILADGQVSVTIDPCPTGIFEESNGIAGYQALSTIQNSGAGGEIVEVRVLYPWKVVIPLISPYFGTKDGNGVGSGVILISASTVVKNEPFD